MKVDFNNLRKQTNGYIESLIRILERNKEDDKVIVDIDEIEDVVNNLLVCVRNICLVHEPDNPDFAEIELKDIKFFNEEE